jgi:hypothetical protein
MKMSKPLVELLQKKAQEWYSRGYQDGWDARESDLIAAIDRIYLKNLGEFIENPAEQANCYQPDNQTDTAEATAQAVLSTSRDRVKSEIILQLPPYLQRAYNWLLYNDGGTQQQYNRTPRANKAALYKLHQRSLVQKFGPRFYV